jgi:glutathionylspermidine synthase
MLIELLPYYAPKLTAVAVGWQKGEDFYTRLDRAVDASEKAKLIEAKVIENTKED